jgi:outer membrane protein assembly factor BamB
MSIPSHAVRGDWPEFRGPMQNGHSPTDALPTVWSENTNIIWLAKTPGLGWSSPVIVGSRVYLSTSVSSEKESEPEALQGSQQLQLVCLDALNGQTLFAKTIFQQATDAPKIHNKNSHASPTPVVRDNRIYVHFGHQGTACTDLDGNLIWQNRDHAYPPTHGNGGSPILVDDKVVITCDGGDSPYTLALNTVTGKEVWRTPRNVPADKPFSFCTPQLIEVNGQKQIISPGSNIVQAIAPDTGNVLWHVKYDGFSVVPRPLFCDGLVLVCTGFGKTKILAIDPTGSGDVTQSHVKWTYGTSVPQTPSLVCTQSQVVMTSDNGIATGIDVKTGQERWRKRLGGNYSASPLVSGDKVYFQSEQGEAIVFRWNKDHELEEIARNPLPGRIFASYGVIDRDLIVRAENGVYRIGQR